MKTNIMLSSNIQPITAGTYIYRGEKPSYHSEKRRFDIDFLTKIVDYEALKVLKSIMNGTNTNEYYFRKSQLDIVNNTHRCGYLHRDYCWGPIEKNGSVELGCMCVNTKCPQYNIHRLMITGYPATEEEIEQFYATDNSCEEEYGYIEFRKRFRAYKVLLNRDPGAIYEENFSATKDKSVDSDYIDEIFDIEDEITQSVTDTEEPQSIQIQEAEKLPEIKPIDLKDVFSKFVECSQEDIITAPADINIAVDAGPGTGKTYTLIQKINYLVNEQRVPADTIQVLCFTNAAVDEIKQRLKRFVDEGGSRELVNVDIRTFHSFSWWLINQANELFVNNGWRKVVLSNLTYDTSITTAQSVVERYHANIFENWGHFIVDEVQDLTNERAKFVIEILKACIKNNCGVTVLGDFCQAIYDYSCKNKLGSKSSSSFYKDVYRLLSGKALFYKLTENHRQNDELRDLTSGLRKAILSDDPDNLLTETHKLLSEVDELDKNAITYLPSGLERFRNGGTVCLLSRSNCDTFRLSATLRKHNIPHFLNVADNKNNYAEWIATVFYDYKKAFIDYDTFAERYRGKTSPEEVWSRIKDILQADRDSINVKDLLDSIATSKIDDPIFRTRNSGDIIVSNIHRSKGREYDSVIVDSKFAKGLTDSDRNNEKEEYRVLYVAVTRPRKQLAVSPFSKGGSLWKRPITDSGRDRFIKVKSNKITYMDFGTEKNNDIDVFSFMHTQKELSNVKIGDEISLIKTYHKGVIDYKIVLSDSNTIVGYLGKSDFLDDLESYNKINTYDELPSEIDELYVSGIHSKVLNSDEIALYPEVDKVAPVGVWKWIEFNGIARIKYDVY